MAEIGFYHLLSTPLERALPRLLERAFAQGHRIVVRAGSSERVEYLCAALWTYEEAAFLPHGSVSDGHAARQPIWLGDFTPAAMRRAARFGDGFTVPEANRDVYDRYVAELRRENRSIDDIRFASGHWCLIVSDDPEKTFAEAADHIIYQANNYSEWLSAAGLQPLSEHLRDRDQLRQSGLLKVGDPDTAISIIRNFLNNVPITHFYSWTLPPGLPPRWAQTHLELFASKVIPAFR